MIGTTEIIMIVIVIILLFGASQIPKLARSLGEGLKEFKKAVKDAKDAEKKTDEQAQDENK